MSQASRKIIWKTLVSVCEVKYHSQLDSEAWLQIVDKAFFTLFTQLNC